MRVLIVPPFTNGQLVRYPTLENAKSSHKFFNTATFSQYLQASKAAYHPPTFSR